MARTRGSSTVGYARVPSIPQHTQLQHDALELADCVRVFEDKISSHVINRPGLTKALDYLSANDTLFVWKLDRLGRSVKEVLTLADDLHERGIGVRILTGRLAGTYAPSGEGKFFSTMTAAFAELERDILHERTMAGLASQLPAPKAASPAAPPCGHRQDRRRDRPTRHRESPTQIARALRVSRATVYRHLPDAPS